MPNSKQIVYLSQAQYAELIANGSITVNGVTVTYNENDIYVTPQAEPITDVKINNVSIGNNGVANIPLATTSTAGVVTIDGQNQTGLQLLNGKLQILPANNSDIKGGWGDYRVIVANKQDHSVFYGLAKASGDTTQANSSNGIGIYTDSAKASIQNMLGITDLLSTEESSTATAAHALNSLFLIGGKLYKATAAIAIGDAVEVGTNCEAVKADEVFVKNTDIATSSTPGLVRFANNATYGIWHKNAPEEDVLRIVSADGSQIKAGTSEYLPITPVRQHSAVFYGLSKLAGVDLANETVTLGTYPETSKTAIRSLIGAAAASDITVTDVQVNGTSVVSNGVANIPAANGNTFGVIKPHVNAFDYYQGSLRTRVAALSDIKESTNTWKTITPASISSTVFYGLAKAAGDTTQSISTNAVGTYTSEAKAAIQTMLDVPSKADVANLIAVSTTAPSESEAKIWIDTDDSTTVQVPTVSEMNLALATKVGDVQVNGSSVVSSGVANIPLVDGITPGVVKTNVTYGTNSSNGYLQVVGAVDAIIKNGTDLYRPIVPARQEQAVFYGLAKAAGDTTQSVSTNAVGTYTDSAKIAIKNMLGVTQTLTVTVLTQDNVTVTGQTVTVRAANATGHVFATAAYEGQPVSFAVPSGFAYYVSVSDTLAHHFNPTTASGIIIDADASVTLTYSDVSSIQTAADIKAALNAGLDLTDLVGEQISCTWNNSTLVWDVVDYSNDTITLLTHDTLPTQLVFEPVQALMWCENGLAAGSYSFIDGSSTYYFTLTTAIPSGGQLRATTSAFQTYASMEATATLETGTVSTTEISGATSLGTTASGNLNHMSRVNYGSNNYKESALFQWLNSTEAANIPMPRIIKFSRPCTYSVPGFLGALDSSFIAAIDDTTWLCSTNNTYECPTSLGGTVAKSNAYTVTAKVGLASEMEIFGSYGGTADGSAVFDLFNGATADDRKKYQPGTSTARVWWLRSPSWSRADRERSVISSGSAISNGAYISYGVVPAVKISKTVVSE